jgi:pimeloyl-ACP methyl ester carboxylesterase
MVSEFNKYPLIGNDSYILPFFKSMLRDKAMHELGIGTMKNMKSIFKEIFLAVWLCRAYTLKEKFNIWVSKMTFINKSGLRDQIISTDFTRIVQEINIPVYFFSGEYDFTVNYELSKEYLTRIKAPVKGFYTFHNSAHSPMFEEPQVLYDIMVEDVLNNTATLADK